jgi:RimJ/RimL family protein N-acetyltransferase
LSASRDSYQTPGRRKSLAIPGVPQHDDRVDWPLFDLKLRCREVDLRPLREDDLPYLASVLPADVGHDPRLELFPDLTSAENERRLFWQSYWRALGSWSPSSWTLHFAVACAGELVGVQTLEGDNFPQVRTVDSASWLVPSVRGRGVGVAMRAAVLGLAFGRLGAVAAITSATVANAASLGVSRRLGYTDNGVGLILETGGVAQLRHLRLTADRWAFGDEVEVTGFEPCRRWFGIG